MPEDAGPAELRRRRSDAVDQAGERARERVGTRLLGAALDFCRATARKRVFLWTVSGLDDAARLYASAGFRVSESMPSDRWGTPVVEERWQLELAP